MTLDPAPLAAALAERPAVARVTVVATRGSVPREAGTSMLVWAGGQSGTIGGGRLEHEAAARARALLDANGPPRADRVALGPGIGQCCGGAVTLVTEVLAAVPGGPTRALRVEGDAPRPAAPGWRDGWLVEAVGPTRPPLWIWGAGHVGRALAHVLAPAEAATITWADVAPERFPPFPVGAGLRARIGVPPDSHAPFVPPGVSTVPAADLPALAAHAPPDAHHLIVTHDHALDLALCDALLRRGFASAGLIGSATKRARFDARLRAAGHAAPFQRIDCPIGDPALGKHPQAIAVGVAAALLPRLQAQAGEAPLQPARPARTVGPRAG